MRTIWKETLKVQSEQIIIVPEGAEPLSVQMQNGHPRIWFMCDPTQGKVNRTIRIVGTGHDFNEAELGRFIDTFQIDNGVYIFHVFEASQ